MRVLLAFVCFCLMLPAFAQKPATTTPDKATGDSPTMKQDSGSLQDVVSPPTKGLTEKIPVDDAVKGWTTWTGGDNSPLVPKPEIDSFGPAVCDAKGDKYTDAIKKACESDEYYVIHVLRLKRDFADPKIPVANEKDPIYLTASNWYLYKRDGAHLKFVKADATAFRPILRRHSAVIVAVVVLEHPVCNVGDKKNQCDTPNVTYTVKVNEKMAANEAALIALANGVMGVSPPTKTQGVLPIWPQYSGYVQLIDLDRGHPRLPFDWVITANVVGQRSGKGDCTNVTSDASCSFTHTLSFTAPQYWNVGIDITPHGPREYKYALSNSNIVTQSHTIHSPLYAAFDFSFWPQQGYRPYFQVGVPLSGAAFHLPFVSVAEPLPFTKKFLQLSVYGGVVFMQQTFPRTLAVGQTSNTATFNADLQTDRALKPIFGIEVPVSSIISKVKSSVGSAK